MERPIKNTMKEMEQWLAQLGMEMDKNPLATTHRDEEDDGSDRAESFDEELAAVLGGGDGAGDHFCSFLSSVSGESNASNHNSPDLDMDYSTFLGGNFHSLSPDDINAISSNPHMFMSTPPPQQVPVHQSPSDSDSAVGIAAKKVRGGSKTTATKRKREPNQVQDHILAERKRRELLSTQFISLSSILPDLKKTDKTSVLGEAIKYMKQLQEKVKVMEEAAAKQTVESVVVVKKSHIIVGDEDYSSSVDDSVDSLPEIEVKLSSDKSMLIKLCCQNHKGILPKLFQQIENLNLIVVNSSVIPFGGFTLDITILAKMMEKEMNANVKDIITSLRSAVIT